MIRIIKIALLLVLGGPLGLFGEELRREDLPPNAEFVIHCNIDAVINNELTNSMIQELLSSEFLGKQLSSVPEELKPLFETAPHGLTFVGSLKNGPELAVLHSSQNQTLIDAIAKSPTYVTIEHRGTPIHHWKGDPKELAKHFNAPSNKEAEQSEEPEVTAYYLALTDDNRLALSDDLRWLVEWIERVNEDVEMMPESEFASRFAPTPSPHLAVVDRLPVANAENENRLPFDVRNVLVTAKDQIEVTASVEFHDEQTLDFIEQILKPEQLAGFAAQQFQAMQANAAQPSKAEPNSRTTEEKPNTLSISAGFRGCDPNDIKLGEMAEFISNTLNVKREGNLLSVKWVGHAKLTYTHSAENDRNHHAFHAWLGESQDDIDRLADKSETQPKTKLK